CETVEQEWLTNTSAALIPTSSASTHIILLLTVRDCRAGVAYKHYCSLNINIFRLHTHNSPIDSARL
ncbi:hypothetical protein J6590_077305, partial [Homalodisca vitripennis]